MRWRCLDRSPAPSLHVSANASSPPQILFFQLQAVPERLPCLLHALSGLPGERCCRTGSLVSSFALLPSRFGSLPLPLSVPFRLASHLLGRQQLPQALQWLSTETVVLVLACHQYLEMGPVARGPAPSPIAELLGLRRSLPGADHRYLASRGPVARLAVPSLALAMSCPHSAESCLCQQWQSLKSAHARHASAHPDSQSWAQTLAQVP
mmetsp:Transcript_15431/g.27023  ORF Transcript_15431/g.27023 Transcript_15431/m.27023 type:complete len:208 (-) Transcript_15431:1045-1668(-)